MKILMVASVILFSQRFHPNFLHQMITSVCCTRCNQCFRSNHSEHLRGILALAIIIHSERLAISY